MVALAGRDPAVLVMHNFQFASGFLKARRWIDQGAIGEIRSVQAYQWSTKARRLPAWYRELPLGLFWDEAAHFLYLTEALVGEMHVDGASAVQGRDPADPTPNVLTALLLSTAGVPVEIAMHFDAGISEWGVRGQRQCRKPSSMTCSETSQSVCPTTASTSGRQVLTTSMTSTLQHWIGVAANGNPAGHRQLALRHRPGAPHGARRGERFRLRIPV